MSYADMTVLELRAELAERGLPQAGKKAELVARLEAAEETPQEPAQEATEAPAGGASFRYLGSGPESPDVTFTQGLMFVKNGDPVLVEDPGAVRRLTNNRYFENC